MKLLTRKCNFSNRKKLEFETKLKWFEEQFRLYQHKLFGSSSEKTEIPEQLNLFNEAESEANSHFSRFSKIIYQVKLVM